jgi:hypothetical protein
MKRSPTQADILIALAQSAELFHAPDGFAHADVDIDGHRETWPIRAKGVRRYLTSRVHKKTQRVPSFAAQQSAVREIEVRAHFNAPERAVHLGVSLRKRTVRPYCGGHRSRGGRDGKG